MLTNGLKSFKVGKDKSSLGILYLMIFRSERYEKSFMHRDVVTKVVVASGGFVMTGSVDGHVKFWKKDTEGFEFVKHFR